ncbi:unnamed protein product [Mortierella alpina]
MTMCGLKRVQSAESAQAAWDAYHFTMSLLVVYFFLLPFCVPALMVWIRNIAAGWFVSFESDHRVLYVAPFIAVVEGVSSGALPITSRLSRMRPLISTVTVAILNLMMMQLVLFGVRYSWQIYFMSRMLAGWLLVCQVVCQVVDTERGRAWETWVWRAFRPGWKQE